MGIETVSQAKCFDGHQLVCKHESKSTGTFMEFGVFLPPHVGPEQKLPVLVYLSGLTCTWENVIVKGGAQRYCAKAGIIFVAPDTSPRGEGVPDDSAYDLGQGAGFYLDATEEPWKGNFRMESYIADELPALLAGEFPVRKEAFGLTGHSMGGHGALTMAMKHPEKFKSVSAFSPIVNPMDCPWGQKALTAYVGDDKSAWGNFDACNLASTKGWTGDILLDQGQNDEFLTEQLKPWNFNNACREAGIGLNLRLHDGYDHSYHFVSTFMKDHVDWHAQRLK